MTALVVRGDALRLPLRDNSVDLIVTSPPYFALRAYQTGHKMEVGSEPSPQAYLEALWAATREMKRVLKPSGSIWVNLGDKYNSAQSNQNLTGATARPRGGQKSYNPDWRGSVVPGIREKSLMGLPWRYAIGCIDQLGLILRRDLIWDKPNGLPESVTDRPRSSHEYWFMFVKQPRYFAALDELREPQQSLGERHEGWSNGGKDGHPTQRSATRRALSPLGKLPGSVWSIGESIWDGPINFCPKCGRSLTGAGNGRAGETEKITVSTGSPTSGSVEPTDSPTNSTSDPSQLASPSTTSAATAGASTPSTSSPSPSARTSSEATLPQPGTPPRPTASTGTSSPSPTRISVREGAESAVCVCETVCGSDVPGSVWSVPSEPLRLPPWIDTQHYAAFPTEWPRRLILGFTPHLICGVCRVGRFPVVDRRYRSAAQGYDSSGRWGLKGQPNDTPLPSRLGDGTEATIVGYACACTPFTDHPGTGEPSGPGHNRPDSPLAEDGYGNVGQGWGGKGGYSDRPKVGPWREYHLADWRPPPGTPAVIADVFGGTGTVAHVAHALGRHAITVDLSEPYCRLAADTSLGSLARQRAAKVLGRVHQERQLTLDLAPNPEPRGPNGEWARNGS